MYQEILAVGIVILIAVGALKVIGPIIKYFDEEMFPDLKKERRS